MLNSKLMSKWHTVLGFVLLTLSAPLALAAPQIESFGVDQVNSLEPGTELEFTVEGTPKARVTLKIN